VIYTAYADLRTDPLGTLRLHLWIETPTGGGRCGWKTFIARRTVTGQDLTLAPDELDDDLMLKLPAALIGCAEAIKNEMRAKERTIVMPAPRVNAAGKVTPP